MSNCWSLLGSYFLCFFSLLVLSGCGTYVPEGQMVVEVLNSKSEFERADMRRVGNELGNNRSIPMKWYDTNTFITSASLEPGTYSFRARNYEGHGIQRDIVVVADKDLYEIDATVERSPEASEKGPTVTGRLQGYRQAGRRGSVSVLFIGDDIIMRSSTVEEDGSFSVEAPRKGMWRIEVHMLGKTPLSYIHPLTNVTGPVNLGTVPLK